MRPWSTHWQRGRGGGLFRPQPGDPSSPSWQRRAIRSSSGLYDNLSGRVARARYVAHKTPQQWRKAVDEHERMLDLLRRRQGTALARLMRVHLRGKAAVIGAAFGRDAASPPNDDDG